MSSARHVASCLLALIASACTGSGPADSSPTLADADAKASAASGTGAPTAAPSPAKRTPEWLAGFAPVPIEKLPATTYRLSFDPFGMRELLRAACGYPDVEEKLLSTTPIYEAKGIGPALFRGDATAKNLACRRALRRALPQPPSVREVAFSLPGSSLETVRFVELDMPDLPPTAPHGRDGTKDVGLEKARCFVGIGAPERPCTDLSSVIAKWPEGKWWVFGRIVSVRALLDATRSGGLGEAGAERFASILAHAPDIRVSELWIGPKHHELEAEPEPRIGTIGGTDSSGARVIAAVAKDEPGAEVLREHHEAKRKRALDPQPDRYACEDCAPLIRRELAAELDARPRHAAKVAAQVDIRRDGVVVVIRHPVKVQDEAYDRLVEKLRAAEAKRAALVAEIVDAWADGKPPTPEAFLESQGSEFVKELRRNLR